MLKFIVSRVNRGWSVTTLGPNEARLLFDSSVSTVGAVIAACYLGLTLATQISFQAMLLAPLVFVTASIFGGIYGKLRKARALKKISILAVALLISCITSMVVTGAVAQTILWALIVSPPILLARSFLALRSAKHSSPLANVVRERGPILVIGGAGYIGSHVVDQLLKSGESVRVLDLLMFGAESLEEFMYNSRFELIKGDATDIIKLTMAMKDCSAVVHLGGLVGDPACAVDPTFTRHANIIATRMARDVAQSLGVSRFIFASSCSVYGCSDKEVQEGDALNPVSLYAQTKIDSEVELLHSPPDDFHVTILRFATVFGHSRRPRFDLVANLFTAQAFHEGNLTVLGPKQWRPFIHVSDLATAVVKVLKAEKSVVQNQIFNVGDESLNMTILQLAELAAEVVGKKHPVQVKVSEDTDDPRTYAVSFRKIQKVLGFKAKYTMRSGIEEMLEHLEKNTYEHFRNQRYSNVASTRRVVEEYFRDPTQQAKLYSPLQAAEPTANQEISPTQGVANL